MEKVKDILQRLRNMVEAEYNGDSVHPAEEFSTEEIDEVLESLED